VKSSLKGTIEESEKYLFILQSDILFDVQ